MSFIQLCNKEKHVFGADFTPVIETIAFSLSHINRYTGHVGQYSVAQHSVLVANELPDELKLSGLLHDATEAYLNDLSKPLKNLIRDYSEFEDFYHDVIDSHFDVDTRHSLVRYADARMLVTEARHFGLNLIAEHCSHLAPYEIKIATQSPDDSYHEFMRMYHELTVDKGI